MVRIDNVRCVGCGLCVQFCPTGAITIKDGKTSINPQLCQGCLLCTSVCPEGAITPTSPSKILEIKFRLSQLSIAISNLQSHLEQLSYKI